MKRPGVTKPLWTRMRDLADEGHERAAELREVAERLERAVNAPESEGAPGFSAGVMVKAWARARRLWCEVTGEELI